MIHGHYVCAQYFLFSLNMSKYLQFHAFTVNSQIGESQ